MVSFGSSMQLTGSDTTADNAPSLARLKDDSIALVTSDGAQTSIMHVAALNWLCLLPAEILGGRLFIQGSSLA